MSLLRQVARPTFEVKVGGTDVSNNFRSRLVSLRVTDRAGEGAMQLSQTDTIEITLSDENGILNIPKKGTWISASLGWDGSNYPMGAYNVDRVVCAGGGERAWTMTVIGTAAAMGHGGFKEQESRHFENTTFGDVARQLAAKGGFSLDIDPDLSQRKIGYESMTEESAMNFVSRLARRFGAVVAVKNRTLVLRLQSNIGSGGQTFVVDRRETLLFRAVLHDRGHYSEVRARFLDPRSFVPSDVIVPMFGGSARFDAGHTLQNKSDADAHAVARSNGLKQGETLLIEVHGRPDIRAASNLVVANIRPGVNDVWPIYTVEHLLNEHGYRTLIECRREEPRGNAAPGGSN